MYILIFSAIFGGKLMLTPLLTLMATLGLPAVLICITSREWEYITWMMYYLAALPIWNFVLPLYSFWHLDDVTWGETRKVEGETVQTDHSGKDGEYEAGAVPVKTWVYKSLFVF
jgi:chitin synthase